MVINDGLMDHQGLAEKVHEILRDEIANGTLPPGSRLTIVELADRLKISRTPVSDAINELVGEGFVTRVPRRGYFVTSLSAQQLSNLVDASTVLQQGAVALGINQIEEELIEKMRNLQAEVDRLIDANGRITDYPSFLRLDRELHLALVGCAQNSYLTDMYTKLNVHATMFRFHYAEICRGDVAATAADDRRPLIDALERRDVVAAQTAIADIMQLWKRDLLNHVARLGA